MNHYLRSSAAALFLCVLALPTFAQDNDWVAESNEHARVVLELLASFGPEGAGSLPSAIVLRFDLGGPKGLFQHRWLVL